MLTVHNHDLVPWQRIQPGQHHDLHEDALAAVGDEPALIHQRLKQHFHCYYRERWEVKPYGWESQGTFALLYRMTYKGSRAGDLSLPETIWPLGEHRTIGVLVDWGQDWQTRERVQCKHVHYTLHVFQRNQCLLRLDIEDDGQDAPQRTVQVCQAHVYSIYRERPDEPVHVTIYSVEGTANFDAPGWKRTDAGNRVRFVAERGHVLLEHALFEHAGDGVYRELRGVYVPERWRWGP